MGEVQRRYRAAAVVNKRNKAKQSAFLAAYCVTASVTQAADACKIARHSHYDWIKRDETYPPRFEQAKIEAGQSLEDEAVRRAKEGVLEPVYYKGNRTGWIRVYSDSLMQTLLRGFLPDKYRDRGSVEVSAPGGGPILLADSRLSALDDSELDTLIGIAQKLTSDVSG
jgi:hypothetical protein